jgi:hypothetical protein
MVGRSYLQAEKDGCHLGYLIGVVNHIFRRSAIFAIDNFRAPAGNWLAAVYS